MKSPLHAGGVDTSFALNTTYPKTTAVMCVTTTNTNLITDTVEIAGVN